MNLSAFAFHPNTYPPETSTGKDVYSQLDRSNYLDQDTERRGDANGRNAFQCQGWKGQNNSQSRAIPRPTLSHV